MNGIDWTSNRTKIHNVANDFYQEISFNQKERKNYAGSIKDKTHQNNS